MNDAIIEKSINDSADSLFFAAVPKASSALKVVEPFTALGSVEPTIRIEDGNAVIRAVDPAHVMVMEATIPDHGTGADYLSWSPTIDVSIVLDKVIPAIKWFGDAPVAITARPEGITISNSGGSRTVRAVVESNRSKHIPLDPPVDIRLDAYAVRRIMDMAPLAEAVRFEAIRDMGIVRVSVATDTESAEVVIPCDVPEDVKVLLPSDYLKAILKAIGGPVTVSVATDYPVRFAWAVGGVRMECVIAPRIEEA